MDSHEYKLVLPCSIEIRFQTKKVSVRICEKLHRVTFRAQNIVSFSINLISEVYTGSSFIDISSLDYRCIIYTERRIVSDMEIV